MNVNASPRLNRSVVSNAATPYAIAKAAGYWLVKLHGVPEGTGAAGSVDTTAV